MFIKLILLLTIYFISWVVVNRNIITVPPNIDDANISIIKVIASVGAFLLYVFVATIITVLMINNRSILTPIILGVVAESLLITSTNIIKIKWANSHILTINRDVVNCDGVYVLNIFSYIYLIMAAVTTATTSEMGGAFIAMITLPVTMLTVYLINSRFKDRAIMNTFNGSKRVKDIVNFFNSDSLNFHIIYCAVVGGGYVIVISCIYFWKLFI